MNARKSFRIAWLGMAGLSLSVLATSLPGAREAPASPASPPPRVRLAQSEQPPPDLVIHEWGTFLGMSGSDGTALEGMYHEEHALPAFVHTRSRDQLRLPFVLTKGETPVIYFYSERAQSVRLGVGFPRGVWTQWYPQAAVVRPSLVQQAESPERLRDGRICWFASIIPPALVDRGSAGSAETPVLPATSADALWNHAREVDAAYVKSIDGTREPGASEYERFLFYRGLGESRLPLRLTSDRGGTMSLEKDPTLGDGVRHVYVIRVENGRGAYQYRPGLRPGWTVSGVIPSMEKARPLEEFSRRIADDLAARLTASGLYAKEARAMVNTWTSSYFQTDGTRVLFILPQSWTEAFIPMTVEPRPKQVVRVMVGRVELLTPQRERLAESAVRSLADADPQARQRAFAFLREQGRYVEPIVRRVLATSADEQVRVLCRRLLLTEFVTELRDASRSAADGKRLNVDPRLVRAQHARLLREMGMESEAKAEAAAVLRALMEAPLGSTMEIQAVALEASGDDPTASNLYGALIGEWSDNFRGEFNPATMAWLRDWWIGQRYARTRIRAGLAAKTVAELEVRLNQALAETDQPAARLCRLKLAYLHDAAGTRDRAEEAWSALEGKAPARLAAATGTARVGSRQGLSSD
jgi:hypothetical protein